jgi:hypothetical protein
LSVLDHQTPPSGGLGRGVWIGRGGPVRHGWGVLVRHAGVILLIARKHDGLDHALRSEVSNARLKNALHEVAKECLRYGGTLVIAIHHTVDISATGGCAGEDLGTRLSLLHWLTEALAIALQPVGADTAQATATVAAALLVLAIGDASTTFAAAELLHQGRAFLIPVLATARRVNRADALSDFRVLATGRVVGRTAVTGAVAAVAWALIAVLPQIDVADAIAATGFHPAVGATGIRSLVSADGVPLNVAAVRVHFADAHLNVDFLAADGPVGCTAVPLAWATVPGADHTAFVAGTLAVAAC